MNAQSNISTALLQAVADLAGTLAYPEEG